MVNSVFVFFSDATQFEPWHLISSFVQYTLMAPSYVNVLNVFAVRDVTLFSNCDLDLRIRLQFANVHDVSWGTKGDNVMSLGMVSTGRTGEVVAAVPDEKDTDDLYEDALHLLMDKRSKEENVVDHGQQQEDYYRNARTK